MGAILKNFRTILKHSGFTFLGILFFILLTLYIILIALPVLIYRLLVLKVFAPTLKKNLGKPLTLISSNFAVEFSFSEENRGEKTEKTLLPSSPPPPQRYTVMSTGYLEGSMNLEEFRNILEQRWIKQKNPDNGSLIYPEFQQYVTGWMGYLFWKTDENFDINNHVTELVIGPKSEHFSAATADQSLSSLLEDLLNKQFPPKRSPWEIILIHNYKNPEMLPSSSEKEMTVVVMRTHHCLGDGFALFRAVFEGIFQVPLKDCMLKSTQTPKVVENTKRIAPLARIAMNFLSLPLKTCRDIGFGIYHGFFSSSNRKTPWNVPKRERENRQNYCRSEMISVDKIKKIKDAYKLSFATVLFSTISAGITSAFQEKEIFKAPKVLPFGIPMPLKGHSFKLINHVSATLFEIPLDEELTSLKRLRKTEKLFRFGRESMIPVLLPCLWKLYLINVYPLVRFFHKYKIKITTGCSSFPGPIVELALNRCKVVALEFGFVLPPDLQGVAFAILSYNGGIRITVSAENSAMNKAEIEKMIGVISEEIDKLYGLACCFRDDVDLDNDDKVVIDLYTEEIV